MAPAPRPARRSAGCTGRARPSDPIQSSVLIVPSFEGVEMSIKVGINGFGRIGRNIFRAAMAHKDIDIVAVNDLTDAATLAHLLKYDSILGNLQADIKASGNTITVDNDTFEVLAVKDPAQLPWKPLAADVVFEGTARSTTREDATKNPAPGPRRV